MFRKFRKPRGAGTDYQYHLRSRINEVLVLKRDVRTLVDHNKDLDRDNDDLAEDNSGLKKELVSMADENVELKRQLKVYQTYMMMLAARDESRFNEIVNAERESPDCCVLGPFESDI